MLTLTYDSDYIFGESSKCLKVKCVSMVGVKTYHRSNEISVETIIPARAREPPLRYSFYILCIKLYYIANSIHFTKGKSCENIHNSLPTVNIYLFLNFRKNTCT